MKKVPGQLTENVKLLQKAVLKHGDKFLILKREERESSRPLAWDLPGGNTEWPETIENKGSLHQDDIAREVEEETGLEISLDNFMLENMISFRTFYEAQKQVFSVIVGWLVELPVDFDEKSIKLSEEHINMRWITVEEIEDHNFGGAKGEFIVEMIRNAAKR